MSNPRQIASRWLGGAIAAIALFFPHESRAARAASDTSGKPMVFEAPPAEGSPACSFRRPICVHGEGQPALDALAALERAWDAGLVLGAPLPASFDAYVAAEPSRAVIEDRDELSRLDGARTFAMIDSRIPLGCARDFDAARALYAASTLARTPAIDEGSLRAESTSLARLAAPCAWMDSGVFQDHPDRAIADRFVAPGYDDGASLFFSWMDDAYGKEPGSLIVASQALAATRSPNDDHWIDEPDVFDVLGASVPDMPDALVAFAIARATRMTPAPRLDWDVAWPAAARTLASPEGIAPTGAAYVRIDTKGRAAGARFDLDATWEQLARIRWTVVQLDARGAEIGRLEANAAPKATQAHLQVVDLDKAAALLVVATNVGPWDGHYDPDDDASEPHGWLLTIRSEP
ncbi:MAG TPA: hypothetical protein VGH28_00445 [Polyangiaceae bacterium]